MPLNDYTKQQRMRRKLYARNFGCETEEQAERVLGKGWEKKYAVLIDAVKLP